jgi:DNA-binding Xre family transcriptional regulator
MAIRIELRPLLEAQGIKRPYDLHKLMDIDRTKAGRIWRLDEKQSFDRDILNEICTFLQCQPGDFIKFEPDRKSKRPPPPSK